VAHVDVLSRHVGAIVQGDTLEKEDDLREQAKEAFCLKQSPGAYARGKKFIWTTMVFDIDVGRTENIR